VGVLALLAIRRHPSLRRIAGGTGERGLRPKRLAAPLCARIRAFAISQFDFPEKDSGLTISPASRRRRIAWPGRAAIGVILNRLILLTYRKRTEHWRNYSPAPSPSAAAAAASATIGRVSGLGDLCGKPQAARHALIGAPAKMLVFMQLFLPVPHYCDAVWPD